MSDGRLSYQLPPGVKLRRTLLIPNSLVLCIAWSSDGKMLAFGGDEFHVTYGDTESLIRLWDAEANQFRGAIKEHCARVYCVAWSPDGRMLASGSNEGVVRLWDEAKQLRRTLTGHGAGVFSVAWSPDGRTLASCGEDGTIRLWDAESRELRRVVTKHSGRIRRLAWSIDGLEFASCGDDRAVRLWDANGNLQRTLIGHTGRVLSVAWSPDRRTLASCSADKTIRIWDSATGQLEILLEGHTARVTSIAFSFDGRIIASKSHDQTVRLWRCDSGESVARLREIGSDSWLPTIAFHPNAPVLVTLGKKDTAVRIWDLDFDALLHTPSGARDISYTNAKVVLMGETGVGKTGLGIRLAEGVWRPTPGSTHGMNVWLLHSEPEREVMLWDFAGQDEYRLVHQLFLNETNVALMLYDPTRSNDTFFGIDYWEKALKNAVPGEVEKFLVAARVNVGGVRLIRADIDDYCKAHGYIAHFATSAETNEACDELRQAIMAAITWERLPRTSSPEVFKRIKDFLAAIRQGNRVLMRETDLLAEFNAQVRAEDAPTEDEFRTVIGHVETAGLIKRLSFGDFVSLKPELLNGYASDVVDAARHHADGLGAVRKADVLDGNIKLKDEGGLSKSDKVFLLHATVELFLRLGLALEQDGNLVFPSKFNQQMPSLEEDPVVEVEFNFEGPVENLYTTLVVKIYYGGIFRLKKLWKNAAEFLNGRGLVCGFQLLHDGEGQGTLKIFYKEGVRDDDKALFLKIIADHFKEKRVEVRRQRIYRCPHCRESVRDRHAVSKALEREAREMPCLYCFKTFPLVDALEVLYRDDRKFLAQIEAMEDRAEASMERGGALVSASAELRTENFKTWAGGADIATIAIVFTDMVGGTGLNIEFGDERWQQVSETHFSLARRLIGQGRGYLLKTKGDGVIAAFHDAGTALDFALALGRDTATIQVKIRAGIHIGPMGVSAGDVFGQQVNMVARIEAKAKEGGVWVSGKIKEDIGIRNSSRHQKLRWTEHPGEVLKGFPGRFTLWSVKE